MIRSGYRSLWLILAVSVLVRIGVAVYLGDVVDAPPLLTDQRSYHALGVRLVEGYGYTFNHDWYPFTPADTPTSHWSFLYSLFVAAVYALFGAHPLAVRLVQAVLGGLLLPWVVYRLARQVVSWEETAEPSDGGGVHYVPIISAAVAAIYGYFILYATTIMTETFYIIALLWSLEVGLRISNNLRNDETIPSGMIVQLGLSLGLAALLRQSILPWIPVLFLWLLWQAWRGGRRLLSAARTLVGVSSILAVCILPWTYRNFQVHGQFLLLNSNAGYAMYSAQHPMHGASFSEFDAAPVPEGWWGQPEPELDRNLMRLGIQFVLDEPDRYLLLSLSRLRAFFEFWPTPDTTLLHNVGRTGSFGLVLPFVLYGLYLASRDSRVVFHNPLLFVFITFYALLHVFTWAMVRYRLPVDAVLMVFAALALSDLHARGRRWLVVRSAVAVPERSMASGFQEVRNILEE